MAQKLLSLLDLKAKKKEPLHTSKSSEALSEVWADHGQWARSILSR